MPTKPARQLWIRAAVGFLAISYGIGAPLTVYLELRDGLLSQRFDLPVALIYATCVVQIVSVVALLLPKWRPWAALALTGVTLGAIGAHLRIGSPQTATVAVAYTVLQVWLAVATWRRPRGASNE